MILIACLDKKGGMLFGEKRQSRDRAVVERILSLTEGKRLFLTPYSAALFPEREGIIPTEHPEARAEEGDFYFVEDGPIPEEGVEGLLLFLWNRHYPATRTLDQSRFSLKRISKREFTGTSHERITEEAYGTVPQKK